jgi:hypothetical protein
VPEIAIAKIETSSSTKTGPSSTTTSTASPAQRKKKGPTPLLVGLLIGGSVLAVILIASLAAVIYFSQSGGDPAAVAGNDSTPPAAKASIAGNASTSTAPAGSAGAQNPPAGGSKFPKPGASWNVLMLDLESERERREVQVQIDGDEQSVPQFGPVAYSLEAGEHQLTVTRPGYEPIHYTFHLSENGQETYRPFWQREGAKGPARWRSSQRAAIARAAILTAGSKTSKRPKPAPRRSRKTFSLPLTARTGAAGASG